MKSRSCRRNWNQKKSNGAIWHERPSPCLNLSEVAPENSVRVIDRFPSVAIFHRGHVFAHGSGLVELSQDLGRPFPMACTPIANIGLALREAAWCPRPPRLAADFSDCVAILFCAPRT